MYVYCVKHLGLDINKVNVKGGAIALGHPLDEYTPSCITIGVLTPLPPLLPATGTRQVATALPELERRGGKVCPLSALFKQIAHNSFDRYS